MGDRIALAADDHTVWLSSPDKELVDGITKRVLCAYWQLIGARTVAAAGGRLVTAKRIPDGPDGDVFFQKHQPKGMPRWIRTHTVDRRRDGGHVDHVVLEDVAHLLVLAQFASVEIHVTTWTADDPEHAVELVLDLDPPPDAPTDDVRAALRRTIALLDELDLPWRVKTTGSKGFHVHVPLAGVDLDATSDLARSLARALVERHPDTLTTEFSKDDRGGRVLVDWWRNSGKATAIAPWSPRIAPGAPIARPLRRDEVLDHLDDLDPSGTRIADVPALLAEHPDDPWSDDLPRVDPDRVTVLIGTLQS